MLFQFQVCSYDLSIPVVHERDSAYSSDENCVEHPLIDSLEHNSSTR